MKTSSMLAVSFTMSVMSLIKTTQIFYANNGTQKSVETALTNSWVWPVHGPYYLPIN